MNKQRRIAYCAGIFDGEGSVSVNQGCIRATASMIDREPLQILQELFGGKLYGPSKVPGRRPLYKWQLTGWRAVEGFYGIVSAYLCPRRRAQFAQAFSKPRAAERVPVKRRPPCGCKPRRVSNAGHGAHYKRGEKACIDCYTAAMRYMRRRRRLSK